MITSERWKQEKLGNVIDTQKGFAFKSAWYCNDGRPIVKVSDFTQDSIDVSALTKIPDEIAGKYLRYELKEGDVVIQTVGSWPSNPASVVGKCIRVPRSAHNALLNQNAVRLSPKIEANNCYLYHALKAPQFSNYIVGTAQGAASQAAITLEAIRAYDLLIPSLPIQRKIASILSAYDDLIENNLRRIKILEEMAQTIYREWFVKFRFPGHEKTRMVDSPMGKIPEGWEVVKVGSLLEKIKRKKKVKKQDYESEGTIPVVDQGRDFIGGYTTDQEALHDKPLPIIVFGDHTRVLKYVGSPFASGADGTQLLLPNTERMPTSLFFYALRSIDLSDFAYARHFKFLKEQEIIVPDEQVARSFAQVADPMRNQIRCLLSQNSTLRRTRDFLLPKLISGELDVSDLDIKTGGHMQ